MLSTRSPRKCQKKEVCSSFGTLQKNSSMNACGHTHEHAQPHTHTRWRRALTHSEETTSEDELPAFQQNAPHRLILLPNAKQVKVCHLPHTHTHTHTRTHTHLHVCIINKGQKTYSSFTGLKQHDSIRSQEPSLAVPCPGHGPLSTERGSIHGAGRTSRTWPYISGEGLVSAGST